MGIGLQIQLEEIENRIILRLDGRVDTTTAPILERKLDQLISEGRHQLILDFLRVDYLSSAGMRVLLSITKKLKAKQGILILFALSDEVNEVIKMAGFEKILTLCSSEKEALQFRK